MLYVITPFAEPATGCKPRCSRTLAVTDIVATRGACARWPVPAGKESGRLRDGATQGTRLGFTNRRFIRYLGPHL